MASSVAPLSERGDFPPASLASVTIVCAPSEQVAEQLPPLPPGTRVVVWDGEVEPPPGVQFLIARYPATVVPDLTRLAELEVVQLLSAGVEGWPQRMPDGVILCKGSGIHGASTAELAIAGLLAVLRRLPGYVRQQDSARWGTRVGESLDGKHVLILGAGDIAGYVRSAVELFGAHTTLIARRPRAGVRLMDELPELLPTADVVVITLPDTPSTEGVVDAGFLAALPDGSVVVNVARGRLIVTDALLAELTSGRLRAFLDVVDPEPLPDDHPLWRAPNLLLTPHVGGGVDGWQNRAYQLVREQVRRFAAGEPLINVVTAGY
jgi:phosphoglycerate dehydrogenase-like enzyme